MASESETETLKDKERENTNESKDRGYDFFLIKHDKEGAVVKFEAYLPAAQEHALRLTSVAVLPNDSLVINHLNRKEH